jgi:predicted nucleic acid-binding protein
MAQRTDCYVDTSAFIAFLDRSDSHHALFRRLFAKPPKLCTSDLVIAEGHGWFLRRYDTRRAIQFLNFIEELPKLEILPLDRGQMQKAVTLIKRFSDQSLTLADAHGLVIMGERRIRLCWSTDRHLALTGVSLAIQTR